MLRIYARGVGLRIVGVSRLVLGKLRSGHCRIYSVEGILPLLDTVFAIVSLQAALASTPFTAINCSCLGTCFWLCQN